MPERNRPNNDPDLEEEKRRRKEEEEREREEGARKGVNFRYCKRHGAYIGDECPMPPPHD